MRMATGAVALQSTPRVLPCRASACVENKPAVQRGVFLIRSPFVEMSDRNFFAELKRRNVYKVAVAYAVVSWLLIQIATQVFPFFEVPNWAIRLVVLLLVLGFPVALVLSWAFEITPEGIKRESEVAPNETRTRRAGRRIIGITIALALVAAGMLAFQLLRSRLQRISATASRMRDPPNSPSRCCRFWICRRRRTRDTSPTASQRNC